MYTKLEVLRDAGERSPVVFLHGFPDSPLMFERYWSEDERELPWLKGRGIYAVAMPNRFTNPDYPPLPALIGGVIQREIDAILGERIAASPTGKIVLVGHDWGSTCSWSFIRRNEAARAGIEKMVALSVGSSFRFDVFEHGVRALGWTYSALFGSAYYLPVPAYRRLVTHLLVRYGGYRSAEADTLYKDAYHYWYGPLRPLTIWPDLIGLRYRPAFTSFPFPVLFIRSPYDRMASTAAFERAVAARDDCRFVLYDDANHWFPEQLADRVLDEIRRFV